MISPDSQHDFIQTIAKAFPGSGFEVARDEHGEVLIWERDGLEAGAGINAETPWVYFAENSVPTDSADSAIGLLQAIFTDEIVAVTAYENDVWVSYGLANASDLHRPPHLLVPISPRDIVRINKLEIRSWSGALDGSRQWPPHDNWPDDP